MTTNIIDHDDCDHDNYLNDMVTNKLVHRRGCHRPYKQQASSSLYCLCVKCILINRLSTFQSNNFVEVEIQT